MSNARNLSNLKPSSAGLIEAADIAPGVISYPVTSVDGQTGAVVTSNLSTSQATTSGTTKDFLSLPATVKRIQILFAGVSLSGTDNLLVQLGDSGGVETTGYVSSSSFAGTTVDGSAATSTAGFIVRLGAAANVISGAMTIVNVTGNQWVASFAGALSTASVAIAGGNKTLSAVLDRVRITTTGTNTFDAGAVNIIYE